MHDMSNVRHYYYYYYYYHHHHHPNYVPKEYSVAAILLLLFMVLISLVPVLNLSYFYISTFRSMCAVPNIAVFCNSLTSRFPGMLFTYFLNDFEIVPVAPIITGITFVFTFYMQCISIVRSLYFRIFSASFLITFVFLIIIIIIIIILPLWIKAAGLLQMRITFQNWTLKGKWQITETHQRLAGQQGQTRWLFNAHKHVNIIHPVWCYTKQQGGLTAVNVVVTVYRNVQPCSLVY